MKKFLFLGSVIISFILFFLILDVHAMLGDYCVTSCDYWGREWYAKYKPVKYVDQCLLEDMGGCRTEEDLADTIKKDTTENQYYIKKCREEIVMYQKRILQYNQCIAPYDDYDNVVYNCGVNSYRNDEGYCICEDNFVWLNYNDPYDFTCVSECSDGFIIDGRCVARGEEKNGFLIKESGYVERPAYDMHVDISLLPYSRKLLPRYIFTEKIPESIVQGYMLKAESSSACYMVDEKGELRWVVDEDVASRLFGPLWIYSIIWVEDDILLTYRFGENIEK